MTVRVRRLRRPIAGRGRRWLSLAAALWIAGCGGGAEYARYAGSTMGTYYQVTARCPEDVSAQIEAELAAVNDEMSTYLEDSVLSRFNRAAAEQWHPVPEPMAQVVAAARAISEASGGAFDVTVGPLVNLWGFGPDPKRGVPAAADIDAARAQVGHDRLEVSLTPPQLRKRGPLYVDLSAIAKGHGVDRVTERLRRAGCDALLVDVGGEVRGHGPSPSGRSWRIGVEVPDSERQGGIQRVVALRDGALATSGDYRNFFDADGARYSHTIDPRTGHPVSHGLASVTVLHDSAMWADGYATALTVLGPEAGMAFAERHELAVLMVVRGASGFEERYTPAFGTSLVE
ncbi:MAG: FAD:protein FMN transferase [Pseudomonadales bacterium]